MRKILLLTCLVFVVGFVGEATAENTGGCIYQDAAGKIHAVNNAGLVPESFRTTSKCFANRQEEYLAKPEDIALRGNVRTESVSTPLGRMELRWPRTVEKLFGRTPQRALAEAANTVSRVLRNQGFSYGVQNLALSWEVVFLDEDMPTTQIPASLISNCHPAWMTPPANLYVVGQRVAAGCGGQQKTTAVNDSQLSQILMHEIGHVVEYQLLNGVGVHDRARAEGFASWFEQYASDFSPLHSKGAAKSAILSYAKLSYQQSPQQFVFQGSALDYARASTYFHAIVEKIGVRGLMEIYEKMRTQRISFEEAVKLRLGWDSTKFAGQARAVISP